MKHIAIAIKQQKITENDIREYWVQLSNPCTKKQAELFKDCVMQGETFAVKTEKEVNSFKNLVR